MNDLAFATGMAKLTRISGVPLDVADTALWHEALCHLSDEDWHRGVLLTIRNEPAFYGRFPAPAVILKHATAEREQQLDVEAQRAYERVRAAYDYSPTSGTSWSWRTVFERCGRAAADAFTAAGGDGAFADEHPAAEPPRRRAFVAAYQAAVRAEPGLRLLPAASEPLLLAAGDQELEPRIPQAQAVETVQKLRELCGAPLRDMPKRRVVEVTDEALSRLRAQAAAIVEEPA